MSVSYINMYQPVEILKAGTTEYIDHLLGVSHHADAYRSVPRP
ncbi:hypothetical protein CITRIK5_70171 [Citricoccus sp. K5]|nr:hypothetical protein CITRIK5_70171 [Citricoccus sp. K5]